MADYIDRVRARIPAISTTTYTGAAEIYRRERARKRRRAFSVDGGHMEREKTGGQER